jgi:hypothetical protein
MAIQWDEDKVWQFLRESNGREFARVKTPRGLRTMLRRNLPGRLEGKCFRNAMVLAMNASDKLWYVEGFALAGFRRDADGKARPRFIPHAWVCPKKYDEDWCIDPTWSWDGLDYRYYAGIRFDGRFAFEHYKRLRKVHEDAGTVPKGGLSLLSHAEVLNGLLPGYGINYGV